MCSSINYGCLSCDPILNVCSSCDAMLYFEINLGTNGLCVCQYNRRLKEDNSSCVCLNHYYDN